MGSRLCILAIASCAPVLTISSLLMKKKKANSVAASLALADYEYEHDSTDRSNSMSTPSRFTDSHNSLSTTGDLVIIDLVKQVQIPNEIVSSL